MPLTRKGQLRHQKALQSKQNPVMIQGNFCSLSSALPGSRRAGAGDRSAAKQSSGSCSSDTGGGAQHLVAPTGSRAAPSPGGGSWATRAPWRHSPAPRAGDTHCSCFHSSASDSGATNAPSQIWNRVKQSSHPTVNPQEVTERGTAPPSLCAQPPAQRSPPGAR